MIPPSGRVPEQGPDCFFMATEDYSSETSDLVLFLGVSIFIGFFGIGLTLRWVTRGPLDTRARQGAWLVLVGCGHLEAHLREIPTPKNPINTETPRNIPRSEVPPPQASVATKNQSRPRSGTLPEGEIITGAIFIIPAAIMMRRE